MAGLMNINMFQELFPDLTLEQREFFEDLAEEIVAMKDDYDRHLVFYQRCYDLGLAVKCDRCQSIDLTSDRKHRVRCMACDSTGHYACLRLSPNGVCDKCYDISDDDGYTDPAALD